jgi:hypothetical protein
MDDKAAVTAQSLLFGPRRSGLEQSPAVGKAKKNEMVKMGKKRAKKSAKDQYSGSWDLAADNFEAGNAAPLTRLLSQPAAHGFKGVESESLRRVTERVSRSVSDFSESQSSVKIDRQGGQLEALILLRDRMVEKDLPESMISWAGQSFVSAGISLANKRAKDDLIAAKDKIGPLPRTFTGDDWGDHFMKNGKSICKEKAGPYVPYGSGAFSGHQQPVHSVASLSVDCEECLSEYKKNKDDVDYLTPAEWAAHLGDVDLDNWDEGRARLGYHGDNVKAGQEQESLDYLNQTVRVRVNEMIDGYAGALI